MHVRTLGRAELSANGTRLGPEAKVAFPLLLHLVLERDHWVARTQLQEMLFPEQDRLHARHSLRQSVYTLRKEGFPIEGSGPALHIPAKGIVDDYSTLLTPQLEGERELAELMGGWLAGFEPTISKAYSHWFEGKRGEVALGMRSTLLAELAVHKRNARWAQCERTCRAILSLDPLNEEATLGLAEALALTGAKVQAIKVLERYQEEMPNSDLKLPAAVLRRRISETPTAPATALNAPALVGRTTEMNRISALLASHTERRSTGLLLLGAPGIGKTRLMREAEAFAALRGFKVATYSCHPNDKMRPLGVISGLIRQIRQLPGALGCAPDALAILGRLDGSANNRPHSRYDIAPQDMSALFGWALEELVASVGAEVRILIAIDDLHLADDSSSALLPHLASSGSAALLAASRPNEGTRELAATFDTLALPTLSSAAVEELLSSLLPFSDLPPGTTEWAQSVSTGNPLFVVSLARHLREHPGSRSLPGDLTLLLEERLSDLTATESLVLAAISALGRHATFSQVEEVLGLARHELLNALDRLESRCYTSATAGVVSPSHPLIGERALGRLSSGARQFLYTTCASALRGRALSGSDPSLLWDVITLAKHGGPTSVLLDVYRACAQHAITIGRSDEACDILRDCLTNSPDDEQLSLLNELLSAAISAGRWTVVQDCIDRLRVQSGTLSDSDQALLAWRETEATWHRAHQHEEILPKLRTHLNDPQLSVSVRLTIADLLAISASNIGADVDAAAAASFAKSQLDADPSLLAPIGTLLIYEASFGDLELAEQYARSVLSRLQGSIPSVASLRLRFNAGLSLRFAGWVQDSCAVLEAGLHDARRYGFHGNAYTFAHELAFTYVIREQASESEFWIREARKSLQLAGESADPLGLTEAEAYHALLRRDRTTMSALAAQIAVLSRPRSSRLRTFGEALYWLALVATGAKGPDDAQIGAMVDEFLRVRNRLEVDPFFLLVAALLHVMGKSDEAKSLASTYLKEFRRERSHPIPTILRISKGDFSDFDWLQLPA